MGRVLIDPARKRDPGSEAGEDSWRDRGNLKILSSVFKPTTSPPRIKSGEAGEGLVEGLRILSISGLVSPPPQPSPQGGGCGIEYVENQALNKRDEHLPPCGGGWEGGEKSRISPRHPMLSIPASCG
jgi:hypothetical protein